MVAVARFLPGRAKDLSAAPRNMLGENGRIGTNGGQMSKTVAPVVEKNEDEQKQKRMLIRNAN